jgi:hypothetical protein
MTARSRRGRMPACAAAVLLAGLCLPMGRAAEQGSDAAKGGAAAPVRVQVELFQVALADDARLWYLRREAPLDTRGPDVAVAELQRGAPGAAVFFDGSPAIVHSTSWRFEAGGTVVLTYLAFGEKLAARNFAHADVQSILWRQLPGLGATDPDRPRPTVLHHEDVLSHGLRHLALLAKRAGNDRFAKRLNRRSRAFFAAIEPEIAGQIGSVLPTPREAR